MNRRRCIKLLASASAALALGGTGYGFYEAVHVRVERPTVTLSRLPKTFDGLRVAFLSDILHGPYTEADHLTTIVRTTRMLDPDLILLGGDYALRDRRHIGPCFAELGKLRAPLGVFGVLGTHDYRLGVDETRAEMDRAKIVELTNAGVNLKRGEDRFWLAGVDDMEAGRPELNDALRGIPYGDACVLLSHNPAFADTIQGNRVDLVLSGATHGGQVRLPLVGSPWLYSETDRKYRAGLVQAPETRVYVSRGLGVSGLPVRFHCRPELTLLTLRSPVA
ncbi:metallophosphoesterase [Limnoglobus roseus]|uniref:Metallophosphoesterase n=1 Tax=Limnoglobus roseus TaxID=2598579 RepID=A0A5C1A8B3_9BACT|nr:metallophosphoesterase [Limnoglobus roseus]QEL14497.1 metallophosphoesterase [Limnoglobus roseus]